MTIESVLYMTAWVIGGVYGLIVVLSFIGALASVDQERKIWLSPGIPSVSLFGMMKIFGLNVVWMNCCLLGAIITVLQSILLRYKPQDEFAHDIVERGVAKLALRLFVGPVEIRGAEHLPPPDHPGSIPAPIYIANHSSQIDVAAVYELNRQFKWIAKSSVLYLPGVGQIMWLSDHVFIDRVHSKKKDQGKANPSHRTGTRNLFVQSNKAVQSGKPMFFFPQGTRRMVERLPFKDGAFRIALDNGSRLIPISIHVPITAWNSFYPFTSLWRGYIGGTPPVVLTIHPPIESKDFSDLETLKQACYDTIYSILPDYQKQS